MAQSTPGVAARRRPWPAPPSSSRRRRSAELLGRRRVRRHRESRLGRPQGKEDRHAVARNARGRRCIPEGMSPPVRPKGEYRSAQREGSPPATPSSDAATRRGRDRRAVEVRVPRVRRRGDLEPGEAAARLPVLRHRVAGDAGGRRRDRRARPRERAARPRRRRARLAGGKAPGEVPELQRDLGARSVAAGAELRVLRFGAARALRGSEARLPSRERAAVQGERAAGPRPHPRVVRQALARALGAREEGADRHRARRLPAVLDVRRARRRRMDGGGRVTTTTRPKRTSRTAARRRARCSTCAGNRPRDGSSISSTTIWFARRWASTRSSCAASSRFRRASSSPTTRATSRAGSSSATRSTSSPPHSARATRWTPSCRRSARSRFPATPSAISSVRADYSGQTFKHILAPVWLLSYNYGARGFQCAMNGVTGAIRGEYPKSPWKVALLVLAIFVVVLIVLSLGRS